MSSEINELPASPPDWNSLAAKPAFQALLKRKAFFIIVSSIFFMVYYFALLVLVGWFPDLMKKEVLGKINLAYLFALSQFFMAWALAYVYVREAAEWDRITKEILAK
jgi:uncharacterized membrane protein (DUF485 family)